MWCQFLILIKQNHSYRCTDCCRFKAVGTVRYAGLNLAVGEAGVALEQPRSVGLQTSRKLGKTTNSASHGGKHSACLPNSMGIVEDLQRREQWSLREKAKNFFFYNAVVGNFCTR